MTAHKTVLHNEKMRTVKPPMSQCYSCISMKKKYKNVLPLLQNHESHLSIGQNHQYYLA